MVIRSLKKAINYFGSDAKGKPADFCSMIISFNSGTVVGFSFAEKMNFSDYLNNVKNIGIKDIKVSTF